MRSPDGLSWKSLGPKGYTVELVLTELQPLYHGNCFLQGPVGVLSRVPYVFILSSVSFVLRLTHSCSIVSHVVTD